MMGFCWSLARLHQRVMCIISRFSRSAGWFFIAPAMG
jgi:hypothetical protein